MPPPVASYSSPLPARGIVLVADGAGGRPEAARAALDAARETGTPIYVSSFDWTHGVRRGVTDMTDVDHAREQGRRFAQHICQYRALNPGTPIYVLSYSAGTHVALEAARWLERDTLERMVLLAPAVSADYDLTHALAVSRQGVDAFTSTRDRLYLGLGTRMVGTADGKRGVPPAGRVGFDTPALDGPHAWLAGRLHQHPWESSVDWTGNTGRHAGSLQPEYFRHFVLPLLTTSLPSSLN